MELTDTWSLGGEVVKSFFPIYRLGLQAAINAANIHKEWRILALTRGCEGETISAAQLKRLWPYAAPHLRASYLRNLIEQAHLEYVTAEEYRLTPQGKRAIERVYKMAYRELAKADLLDMMDMKRLATLLWKLVQAALQAHEPADKTALRLNRWSDGGLYAPAVTRIDQYLTDLQRFRDDCHYATWQGSGLEGIEWDAFTTIWRGEANSAEMLTQKFCFRGYSAADYTAAINRLVNQGWVQPAHARGTFVVTEQGRHIREEAERCTDDLFFAPWAALTSTERRDLHLLLNGLVQTLRQPV